MTQARKTSPSWLPYLFLLLIPLMLVGLDSYGWLFTRKPALQKAMGLWPSTLSAHTPHTLSLLLPPQALIPDHVEIKSQDYHQDLKPEIQGTHWKINLPPLPAGHYTVHLKQNQTALDQLNLVITEPAFWQMRSDRQIYQEGDWLIVSLKRLLHMPQSPLPLVLEVHGPHDEILWQQVIPGFQGVQQQRVHLPEGLVPGQGVILLRQGSRPLETRGFTILPPHTTGTLQLIPERGHLLAATEQTLMLNLIDGAGQAVEDGWVRILGKTLPVHHGQAELNLKSPQEVLDYVAGDSRGNLLQGHLVFEIQQTTWMPHLTPSNQVEILGKQAQTFSWLLGQNHQILDSGLSETDASHHLLALPPIQDSQPLWLRICDLQGECQQIQWLPQAQKSNWQLQPLHPHALDPLKVIPASAPTGQIESFRGLQTGFQVAEIEAGSAPLQWIGQPEATQEKPFWLFLWTFCALVMPIVPLVWFWHVLRHTRRPFPNQDRRQSSDQAQIAALTTTGFTVLGVTITWLSAYTQSALLCLILATLLIGFQIWKQRGMLKVLHPLMLWLPLLQMVLLGIAIWFCLTYQPATLGAGLLSLGLYSFCWSLIWQDRVPIPRLRHPRNLTLITLLVGSLAHCLILPGLNQPEPHWLMSSPSPLMRIPAIVPMTRMLDHQIWPAGSNQILPAPRRSGMQLLQWRYWSDENQVQDYQQSLPVQPTTLAELQLPDYALIGDRLSLPIRFVNETNQIQELLWRLNQGSQQNLTLAARTERSLPQETTFETAGWQSMQVEHQFKGKWYVQNPRIFVQPLPIAHQDPRLQLRIDLPQASQLVPGEEIPVIVHLRQTSGRHAAIGLQIGIPSSFTALTDTLGASARRTWLANYFERPGQLNLQTLPLANDQEVSFHFRLQATLPGKVQMPPARMFLLDQPEVETINPVTQWLETLPGS